jgi:hypothetical protein
MATWLLAWLPCDARPGCLVMPGPARGGGH